MQLFKKVVLSLFPEETSNEGIHPASMFISFISTKDFFSIINRRIVENYKINLFDTNIDPFEFKIGFGENVHIKQKDVDNYYSYCATANMNGYRFCNPANTGSIISMIASIYLNDCFKKHPQEYFLNMIYAIYLLFFIFSAKIKIFPYTKREENYNRFIQILFERYVFMFEQTGKTISQEILLDIKKEVSKQSEILFLLFTSYQKYSDILTQEKYPQKDFYLRLYGEEFKNNEQQLLDDLAKNREHYSSSTKFSIVENRLLQSILPNDILIRYLFLDSDIPLLIETTLIKIFPKETMDIYLKSFLKNDEKREDFLLYISDYKHFKKNFFSGIKKYIFSNIKPDKAPLQEETNEEEEDSWIGEGEDIINHMHIPESIKRESKIMEKVLNFFVTFLGGFRIARGDAITTRITKKQIFSILGNHDNLKEKSLYFYGNLLYEYGKNIFYYKYISENVKLGRQRFYLPLKSNNKKTYANHQVLRFFDEHHLLTVLQEINPKDLKIYTKNKEIIKEFKEEQGELISHIVQQSDQEIINLIYMPIQNLLSNKKFISTLQKTYTSHDLYRIKEQLYTKDFRISRESYIALNERFPQRKKLYDDNVTIGICALLRETIFGFLLLETYVKSSKNYQFTKIERDRIQETYIQNILNIQTHEPELKQRKLYLQDLQIKHKKTLEIMSTSDDNEDFLRMGTESRINLLENKKGNTTNKIISGDDIVRFKGFLKNITYYNKRFLIPK